LLGKPTQFNADNASLKPMSISIFLFLFACSLCPLLAGTLASSDSEKGINFNYNNHGEDWMVGECASRDRQSPIDFSVAEAPWSCNPPMPQAMYALLPAYELIQLGYAPPPPAAGVDTVQPMGAPVDMGADEDAMLQLGTSASNGFLPKAYWLPTAPPALMFPGCGGPLGMFFFRYDRVDRPLRIQNNGRSIATDLKGHGLGSLVMDNIVYDVLSVNFHVWSEHTFQGQKKPLELHIVHRDPDTNCLIVVAVAFDTTPGYSESEMALLQQKSSKRLLSRGRQQSAQPSETAPTAPEPQRSDPGFSDALANLYSYPLPGVDEVANVNLRAGPVDVIGPLLGALGPYPQGFFQYRGSLTAPPCSEQVTWLVRRDPLIASHSQIELIRSAIMQSNSNFPNSRATMPLMGRNILYRLGFNGEAPPPATVGPTAFPQPPLVPNAEFYGVSQAKAAANEATALQGAKDAIMDVIAKAQVASTGKQASVNPMVSAKIQSVMKTEVEGIAQLPTPSPEVILHRMVNVVADQLQGPERNAAIAAAMAGIGPPAAPAPAAR
jgi:carbonic anhydrase